MNKFKLSSGINETIIYGVGLLLTKSLPLILLPVITFYIAKANYGRLQLIGSMVTIALMIVSMGLNYSLLRFASEYTQIKEKAALFGNALLLTFIISLVFDLVLLLILPWCVGYLTFKISYVEIIFCAIQINFTAFNSVQLACLRATHQARLFTLANIGQSLVQVILIIVLLKQGFEIDGILAARAVAIVLVCLAVFCWQWRHHVMQMSLRYTKLLLSYGAPLIFSGLASFCLLGLDQWWIASVYDTATLAPYALALQFATATQLLLSPFLYWWLPRRFELLKQNTGKEAIARIATAGICLSLMASIAVTFGSSLWIRLWMPASYQNACDYIGWLSFLFAIPTIVECINLGCYNKTNTILPVMLNLLMAGMTIIGFYLLIPRFQIMGALLAMYGAYAVSLVLVFVMSQRHVCIAYPMKHIAGFALLCILLILLEHWSYHIGYHIVFSLSAGLLLLGLAIKWQLLPLTIFQKFSQNEEQERDYVGKIQRADHNA